MSWDDTDQKIPIIDFKPLSVNQRRFLNTVESEIDQDEERVCTDICEAFKNIGFVYLKNTGITEEEVGELHDVARDFFSLDPKSKAQFSRDPVSGVGWAGNERTNPNRPVDLKETFNIQPTKLEVWPETLVPSFRTTTEKFHEKCTRLTHTVLFAISSGLNLPDKSYLNRCHHIKEGRTHTTLRLLYYPPVPQNSGLEPGQIRLGEHTDWGSITLLFQDQVGGLEVQCRDGVYRPATPIPGTVLVNIADLLQRWTADRLVSNSHRVLVPEDDTKRQKSRYSVVFFVHPDDDEIIKCLDGSDRYQPVGALQYLIGKFGETY